MVDKEKKEKLNNKYTEAKLLGAGLGVATGLLLGFISPAIGIPIVLYGMVKVRKYSLGNYTKNSSFCITDTYKGFKNCIVMEMHNPLQLLNTALSGNKEEALNVQLLNFFNQLDKVDKNGKTVQYTATTNKAIIRKIYALQRQKFIEGLPPISELPKSTKIKKKSLLIEKLILGNMKSLKQELKNNPTTLYHKLIMKNKKVDELQKKNEKSVQFYDISFNLTGKKFTKEDADELLKRADHGNYNMDVNEDGTLKSITPKTISLLKNRVISESQSLFQPMTQPVMLAEHTITRQEEVNEETNQALIAAIRGNPHESQVQTAPYSSLHERIQNMPSAKAR